ncbi:MAG: hypothetical protein Q8K70_11255 [Bacteroidota bacterium]|nr:hypothetical protein [Bacteroidota bacterium]
MKRMLSIGFIILFLFTSTVIEQLFKLPQLIEHFSEHKLSSSHLSFLDFLKIHYVDEEEHGKTSDKDQNLPFKTIDVCQSLNVIGLPIVFENKVPVLMTLNKNISSLNQESFISSSFLSSIWQPPKSI